MKSGFARRRLELQKVKGTVSRARSSSCNNALQNRFLRLRTLRQRFVTTRSLQFQLEDVYNVRISCETVRQRLKENNLINRIPARELASTVAHCRAHLEFARNRVHCVFMCTDVRTNGMHNATCEKRRYSLMVWGDICLTGRTDLMVLNNGITSAHRYIVDVLQNHVPVAPNSGRLSRGSWNQRYGMISEESNFNPIENVWDLFGRCLWNFPNQPNILQELEQSHVEIWNELDENTLRPFILSMDRRCQAVIRKRGGNTSY
ncbi:hypothetical protein ILUMI_17824 [Ignelater luminosus]|uniref:Transposase Tc1-like domain-containing protein n=1 Tax=Ignelater luminosus TaxID=2038154 RepID=A0A8K0CL18_IGNLU|nr:hypothetical protein ILUMI_17824 [Ignelater luminosus]